jgi:hypothetical protein
MIKKFKLKSSLLIIRQRCNKEITTCVLFIIHFLKPIAKIIHPHMVFKNNRKTKRKIREPFKTLVLRLRTVKATKKERKPTGKTYSL